MLRRSSISHIRRCPKRVFRIRYSILFRTFRRVSVYCRRLLRAAFGKSCSYHLAGQFTDLPARFRSPRTIRLNQFPRTESRSSQSRSMDGCSTGFSIYPWWLSVQATRTAKGSVHWPARGSFRRPCISLRTEARLKSTGPGIPCGTTFT